MATKIRIHQAYMTGRGKAMVYWHGWNGKRQKEFGKDTWGFQLVEFIQKSDELKRKALDGEVEIIGTLSWDQFEVELEFTPIMEGADTAEYIALSVHES